MEDYSNYPWISFIQDELDPRYGVKVGKLISANDGDVTNSIVTKKIIQTNGEKYVIDIGADEGWWAFFCLEMNPKTTVDAFEPNPISYKKLKEQLEEYPSFHLHNVAVSDKNGTIPFSLGGEQSHSRTEHGDIQIPCKPLMDYVKDRTVDLMKIDVEGHELTILHSLHPYINQFNAIIFEFTTHWYGNTREECINRSIEELFFLKNHYKYMQTLSRRTNIELMDLEEEDIIPFVKQCYEKKIQTDILVSNTHILI
jgi:FkbM family methyltransferase